MVHEHWARGYVCGNVPFLIFVLRDSGSTGQKMDGGVTYQKKLRMEDSEETLSSQ